MTNFDNFSFENINKSRKETLLKSFSSDLTDFNNSDIDQEISKAIELDIIEKGRKGATIGEIREWSGKKYQKTTQGWKPVKGEKSDKKEESKPEDKKDDNPYNKESKEDNIVNKQFKDFIKLAKESKNADELIVKIREYGNVAIQTSNYFHKEYAEDGKLTIKQAVQRLFDEAHGEKDEPKKEVDVDKLKKEYDSLTDENDHGGAAKLLVDAFGTDEEKEKLKNINDAHEKRGNITESELKERRDITQKYYNKISSSKKEEKSKSETKDKKVDIKKQHKDLLDKKDYVGASKLLVDTYGTDEEKKKINDFIEADKKGETTEAGYKEFDSIVKKYSKEVEKKPRKPRTKKADMIIKEGNVKTQYPDIDFDKLPKDVVDDFNELSSSIESTMDEIEKIVTGKDIFGRKYDLGSWDKGFMKNVNENIKEKLQNLYKKDLSISDKIKEFSKIDGIDDVWDYISGSNEISDFIELNEDIKKDYPDASTTKDKDQLRLFKSLSEIKKDHISKSISGY